MTFNYWWSLGLSCLCLSGGALATLRGAAAADGAANQPADVAAVEIEKTEMFQAISEGKIEVNFYPRDASLATVIIRSKGDKPLDVQLPKAFGAVHVLGQMGMGGGGYGGGMGGMGGGMGGMGGGMGGMGGGQGMGGGMGGMGGGMGGMGGGMGGGGYGGGGMGGMGGMFRVEPEKTHKFQIQCVCLEHGKPDPNPRMKYQIVPIERINNDPRVSAVCEMLGYGRIPQNTAQATAWHLANKLTFEELAMKNRVESKYTGNVRFFNQVELRDAFQLSQLILRRFEELNSSEESTGYIESPEASE
jgi:hypothetical protein